MKCCKCHKEDSVGHGIHFWYFKSQVVLCEDCYEKYGVERMVFEHKFLTDALDDKMTTLVTLSDGWGHVREAYYDKGRQLVFTECISVKELDSRRIYIHERKKLSDSEVKPNCVTCDHFGKCEGCERSGEE